MLKKMTLKDLHVDSFVTAVNGRQFLGGEDHTCVCPPPTYTCNCNPGPGGTGGGGGPVYSEDYCTNE